MRETLSRYRRDILTCVGAVAVGCLALVLVLQLWNADLNVPLNYGAPCSVIGHTDRLSFLQLVKSIHDVGGTLHNPYVGAPEGLDYRPYPQHEHLHFLLMRALSWFTPSYAVTANLYFLLSFPLSIITAFIACRSLGVLRLPAVVVAVLFAFLPYHFMRGLDHFLLATYFHVPLGFMIATWVWLGRPLVRQWRPLRLTGLGWAALAIGVIMGAGGIYYAAFTGMFLAAGWGLRALRQRNLRSGADALLPIAVIVLVMGLQMLPTIHYKMTAQQQQPAVMRQLADAEVYGLKIAQLVLPVPGHRIPVLAEINRRYSESTLVTENMATTLGFVGAAGFVLLCFWLLRCRSSLCNRSVTQALAEMNLLAVAFATFGGGSVLLALGFGSYLRSSNRISVFIALFALVALAYPAGWFCTGSSRRRVLGVLLLGAILVLGVLDQTTTSFVPDYAADKADFQRDHEFVSRVEAAVPPGAMIYQLPYLPFPEATKEDYQPFRGYLHSRQLRWSYGAMRGTISDQWALLASRSDAVATVRQVREAGFAGIYVDRKQMPNWQQFEYDLQQATGLLPIFSSDARLAFYRLP